MTKIQELLRPSDIKFHNFQDPIWFSRTYWGLKKKNFLKKF